MAKKTQLDALGKPLDPEATYVALTGFASGYNDLPAETALTDDCVRNP